MINEISSVSIILRCHIFMSLVFNEVKPNNLEPWNSSFNLFQTESDWKILCKNIYFLRYLSQNVDFEIYISRSPQSWARDAVGSPESSNCVVVVVIELWIKCMWIIQVALWENLFFQTSLHPRMAIFKWI